MSIERSGQFLAGTLAVLLGACSASSPHEPSEGLKGRAGSATGGSNSDDQEPPTGGTSSTAAGGTSPPANGTSGAATSRGGESSGGSAAAVAGAGSAGSASGAGNVTTGEIPGFPITCTTASTPRANRIGNSVLRVTISREEGNFVVLEGAPHAATAADEERLSVVLKATVSRATIDVAAEGLTLHATRRDEANAIYAGTFALPGGLGGLAEPGIVCWGADFAPHFRYDASSGTCRDAAGVAGKNSIPVPMMRESKQAECAAPEKAALNENDLTYPTLDSWQAAGADFSQARLSFAMLTHADLRGANLGAFDYGYATLSGTADAHTVAPASGCMATPSSLECHK